MRSNPQLLQALWLFVLVWRPGGFLIKPNKNKMNTKNSLVHYNLEVVQTKQLNANLLSHTINLTLNLSDGTATGETKVPVTMNHLQAQRLCNYLINAINAIAKDCSVKKQKVKSISTFN